MPPLNKRGDDVVLLAEHFLEVGNRTYSKNIQGFSESVMEALKSYTKYYTKLCCKNIW